MITIPSLLRHRSFTVRLLVLLFVCALPIALLQAQERVDLVYKARLVGSLGTEQEKWIMDVVLGRSPDAVISLDLELAQGKIRTRYPLDAAALNQELAPHGVQLELSTNEGSGDPATYHRLYSGFPVLIHTGDPLFDQADYERRKQDWLQAHPTEQPNTVGTP